MNHKFVIFFFLNVHDAILIIEECRKENKDNGCIRMQKPKNTVSYTHFRGIVWFMDYNNKCI